MTRSISRRFRATVGLFVAALGFGAVGCEALFPTVPDEAPLPRLTVLATLHTARDVQVLRLTQAGDYPAPGESGYRAFVEFKPSISDATVTVTDETAPDAPPVAYRFYSSEAIAADSVLRRLIAPAVDFQRHAESVYLPMWIARDFTPLAGHRYTLHVSTAAGEQATASTTLTSNLSWSGSSLTLAPNGQLRGGWAQRGPIMGPDEYVYRIVYQRVIPIGHEGCQYDPVSGYCPYAPALDPIGLRYFEIYSFPPYGYINGSGETKNPQPIQSDVVNWRILSESLPNFGRTTVDLSVVVEQPNVDIVSYRHSHEKLEGEDRLRIDRVEYSNLTGALGVFGGVTLTRFRVNLPAAYYASPDLPAPDDIDQPSWTRIIF